MPAFPQFKLSAMFLVVTVVALIVAFYLHQTVTQFIFTGVALAVITGFIGKRKLQKPVLCASLAGIAWPLFFVGIDAFSIVIRNQRFQGQLYDEDGPAAFVFKTVAVCFILGLPGFIVGNLIGWTINWVKFRPCEITS